MHDCSPRAIVEVDVDAIAHNLHLARQAAPGCRIIAVVKANAYGHGLEQVVRRLDAEQPAFFGVANAAEARQVQATGCSARPFLLGPNPPTERAEIAASGWGFTISSIEEADHFASLAADAQRVLPVHLAVDTGMGREGFLPTELGEVLAHLQGLPFLRVDGVMSHMPVADEDEVFSHAQVELFEQCVREVSMHAQPRYVHLAASAGILRYKVPCANTVRPGLMLYGIAPVHCTWEKQLRSALRLRAAVTLVRSLPTGHGVSYGRCFVTPHSLRVATIGIGYADGWRRHLSGRGVHALIHGQLCPLLGRVTMDQIMADVSAVPGVQSGDMAELIGPSLSVEELAMQAGTIPWDILTGLGPRLPRVSCSMGGFSRCAAV